MFVHVAEQQSANDEFDQQSKQQQQRSSNNPSNANSMNRPTQLQSKQQASTANNPSTQPLPPPLSLPNQDENTSSHDTMNSNTTGTTYSFFE